MTDTRRDHRTRREDDDQSWDKPVRPVSRLPGEIGARSGRGTPAQAARRNAREEWRQSQLAGIQALLELDGPVIANLHHTVPLFIDTKEKGRGSLLKDPAIRGALALMFSAGATGVLSYVFWAVTAHRMDAAAVGKISAEVSAITFLATVGSLNLTGIFGRFLPVAGWHARRLVATGYGSAAVAGLVVALIYLTTPLSKGSLIGGSAGTVTFVACVVLNSIFNIQDGGLIGFGRFGWIPVENTTVALVRFGFLPVMAIFLSSQASVLGAWLVPMALAVIVVNIFNLGPLPGRKMRERPKLPRTGSLLHMIAVNAVSSSVTAVVSSFLPAFVAHRLGAAQGGYFYVPWMITTMVALLMMNVTTSMVREVVANPKRAGSAIRRSIGMAALVVVGVMVLCLLLANLILTPLGPAFVTHGAPLMRWVGLTMPATAVIIFFWANCSIYRRPWPSFGLSLFTAIAVFGGILLLPSGSGIASVGMVYCVVQWVAALVAIFPTFNGLRAIARREKSRRQ